LRRKLRRQRKPATQAYPSRPIDGASTEERQLVEALRVRRKTLKAGGVSCRAREKDGFVLDARRRLQELASSSASRCAASLGGSSTQGGDSDDNPECSAEEGTERDAGAAEGGTSAPSVASGGHDELAVLLGRDPDFYIGEHLVDASCQTEEFGGPADCIANDVRSALAPA
jgi:hypothetical protein